MPEIGLALSWLEQSGEPGFGQSDSGRAVRGSPNKLASIVATDYWLGFALDANNADYDRRDRIPADQSALRHRRTLSMASRGGSSHQTEAACVPLRRDTDINTSLLDL